MQDKKHSSPNIIKYKGFYVHLFHEIKKLFTHPAVPPCSAHDVGTACTKNIKIMITERA